MGFVVCACVFLVVMSTVLHYEGLRLTGGLLPRLHMPSRPRLVVAIVAAFSVHAVEILLYAAVFYGLARHLGPGTLGGAKFPSILTAYYFSAETYTSVGYGDVVPHGPLRLLAGVETLNGLLLIGWSASFTYITMERFWTPQSSIRDDMPGGGSPRDYRDCGGG